MTVKKIPDIEDECVPLPEQADAMSIDDLLAYLRRDLTYLEGVADALDNVRILKKVLNLRHTLNLFEKGLT